MITLTKPQRQSLHRVWLRTHEFGYLGGGSYRAFRRQVQPGPGCVLINFAGMWLGIEPDGLAQPSNQREAHSVGFPVAYCPTRTDWCTHLEFNMRDYVISYQRQSLAISARTPFEAQNKAQPRFEMALNMAPGTLATKVHLFAVRLQGYAERRHGVPA